MKIRIGTRKSELALIQTQKVVDALHANFPDLDCEIVKISTTGDKIKNTPLYNIGGKALFLKELENALCDGSIDIAVHSMKDVPAEYNPNLLICAVLKRDDPREVLIVHDNALKIKKYVDESTNIECKTPYTYPHKQFTQKQRLHNTARKLSVNADLQNEFTDTCYENRWIYENNIAKSQHINSCSYNSFKNIADNSVFGTSSMRRMLQVYRINPNLCFDYLRGNVATRISKVMNLKVGATLLAKAGIDRLKIKLQNMQVISSDVIVPAVGQGVIAMQTRSNDFKTIDLCLSANDTQTWELIQIERGFLEYLNANCTTPIGVYARYGDEIDTYGVYKGHSKNINKYAKCTFLLADDVDLNFFQNIDKNNSIDQYLNYKRLEFDHLDTSIGYEIGKDIAKQMSEQTNG